MRLLTVEDRVDGFNDRVGFGARGLRIRSRQTFAPEGVVVRDAIRRVAASSNQTARVEIYAVKPAGFNYRAGHIYKGPNGRIGYAREADRITATLRPVGEGGFEVEAFQTAAEVHTNKSREQMVQAATACADELCDAAGAAPAQLVHDGFFSDELRFTINEKAYKVHVQGIFDRCWIRVTVDTHTDGVQPAAVVTNALATKIIDDVVNRADAQKVPPLAISLLEPRRPRTLPADAPAEQRISAILQTALQPQSAIVAEGL